MRAVVYTRVSSDPRDTGRSVEEQEADCRAVCDREGWMVVRVFADNDRSASRHARKSRPQYEALRAFLTDGGADVLVMWEGSRAQRDISAYASLRDLCAERGVGYSYSGRLYDLTRTDDRFSTALDAVLAEREADVTRDRVLRSVRANAAKGRPHGKLAYGYAREYDVRGEFVKQVEQPDQADVVRECGRRVAAGESLYSIAQDLNAREVAAPRGGTWLPTQVRRLVTNPSYVGQRVHRGAIVGPALWPAILEERVWAECVRLMADPRRSTVRDSSLKHLLSGSLRCGVCGGRTRVLNNRGYPTYVCYEKFCTAVRTTPAEELVVDMVTARLEEPDVLDQLSTAGGGSSAAAEREADEKQRRLDGFVESAAAGGVSPAALAKIEARLLPEIADARRRALVVPVPALLRQVAGPGARARWDRLDIGQRRWLIDQLVELRVSTTVRGSRFTDWRLAGSRWIGDERTWGERWTAAGID